MAVSMNVDYTRQIYTGLSTDSWGGIEFNAGDVVYIMDHSECWIFDGSTMHQLPDLGGGGGGTIISKTITEEGTYDASLEDADGYNPVTVTFPVAYRDLTITNNRTGGTAASRAIKLEGQQLYYRSAQSDYELQGQSVAGNGTTKTIKVLKDSGATTFQYLMFSNMNTTQFTFTFSSANSSLIHAFQGSGNYWNYVVKWNFADTITIS